MKLNMKFMRLCGVVAVVALLLGSMVFVVANETSNDNKTELNNNETENGVNDENESETQEEPLGKQIAFMVRELVREHKSNIENFIDDLKIDVAHSNQDKLDRIDEQVQNLHDTIAQVKELREDLIAEFEAGGIDVETFEMEMKKLNLQISDAAKDMGRLGHRLGELGQTLGELHRERAQNLVGELQGFGEEMSEIGHDIAEQMKQRGFGPPDLPNIPDVAGVGRLAHAPGGPDAQDNSNTTNDSNGSSQDSNDNNNDALTRGSSNIPDHARKPQTPNNQP